MGHYRFLLLHIIISCVCFVEEFEMDLKDFLGVLVDIGFSSFRHVVMCE
uniref:Uncharacterized protein n=1 Tax=Physcomitrium patens TaxID=3218 RepID=A0A2K1KER0_PHYPA|nr:hypothetical protein PHYPA_008645 [Physcomitrium patens]